MRTTINRILNLALYLIGCAAAGTGLLLAYRLPPGSRGGHGLTLLGMDRHEWGDVHLILALVLIGLTVLHLVMHRQWLAKVAASKKAWRLGLGLAAGLAVLAFFLFTPVAQSGGRLAGW